MQCCSVDISPIIIVRYWITIPMDAISVDANMITKSLSSTEYQQKYLVVKTTWTLALTPSHVFRNSMPLPLSLSAENAPSTKNWIGLIQYFPAETARRFSTGPVLTVWRVRLHVGLSPLQMPRLHLWTGYSARHTALDVQVRQTGYSAGILLLALCTCFCVEHLLPHVVTSAWTHDSLIMTKITRSLWHNIQWR